MNDLNFSVVLFDYDDNHTSEHKYRNERTARKKYKDCVTSARCANVGRIKLYERKAPSIPSFNLASLRYNYIVLEEWYNNDRPQPEPDFQVEGYIVHSVRTLNGTMSCGRGNNKKFHDDEGAAVEHAKSLAEKWSGGHPGLLVFKAIKHVHKCSVRKTHVVVEDL